MFYIHLIPELFGFRSRKSATNNRVSYSIFLINAVEIDDQVDSIYTDISKAFYSACHTVLMKKLELMCVNNPFLFWLNFYICNRSHIVNINGFFSNEIFVPSDVP